MKKEARDIISLFLVIIFLIGLLSDTVSAAGTCSGTASACSSYNGDSSGCTSAGCSYNSQQNKCNGSPTACSSYSSQSTCQAASCTWTETTIPPVSTSPSATTPTTSTGVQHPPVKIVLRHPKDQYLRM